MRRFLTILVVALLSSCGAKTGGRALTTHGLAPVEIGMTVAQAESALGAKLKPRGAAPEEEGCWYTSRTDRQDDSVFYMVSDGAIVRIDIRNGSRETSAVISDKGFGVGSDEKAIVSAYGPALTSTPHKYLGEDGRYLRVSDDAGKSALLFETDKGKVTTFRAGRVPFVDYVEGCS